MAVVCPSSLMMRFLYRVLVSNSFLAITLSVPSLKNVGAESAISDKLFGGDLRRGTSRILTTDSTFLTLDNLSLSCLRSSIDSVANKSCWGL